MDEILRFLLQHGSFLYKEFGFRFVDSQVSNAFGGDAFLILAKDTVRLRLVRDRGQLFADFQETPSNGKEWFSIDIVRKYIAKEHEYFSELDSNNAKFLRERLPDIEAAFRPATFDKIRREFQKLEKERAKSLFG